MPVTTPSPTVQDLGFELSRPESLATLLQQLLQSGPRPELEDLGVLCESIVAQLAKAQSLASRLDAIEHARFQRAGEPTR